MATIAHWGGVLKRQVFQGDDGLSEYWSAGQIEAACEVAGHVWRDRFWTPLLTLRTFLLQVLHAGSSCRAAVAMALGQNAAMVQCDASGDPSAYCQARRRLPLEIVREGVRCVGRQLQSWLDEVHHWCGRRIWLVDGSSCSMPDTPELQKVFGQPDGQN